jgi:hypothetical protein
MTDWGMSFDPGSLARIAELAGMGVLMDAEIAGALVESSKLLVEAAQAKTWEVFENPTGALADSIYPWIDSPHEVEVRVGVPYGRRREYGFSGMTDSLGRFYAYDPGKPYLGPTLEEHKDEVRDLIAAAVEHTLGRLGGL